MSATAGLSVLNIDITMAWVCSSYNIAKEEYLHRLKELNSR